MSMTPRGYERFSTLSPQQSDIFNTLQSRLMGQLGGQDRANFEAPYLRQFNEKTIPGIAERFSGMGEGAQSSNAFRQSLGAAGAGLSENLASLGENREQNSMQQLMQLLGLNTEGLTKKEKPWWQGALIGLGGGLGQGLGSLGANAATGGFSKLKEFFSLLSLLGEKGQNNGEGI